MTLQLRQLTCYLSFTRASILYHCLFICFRVITEDCLLSKHQSLLLSGILVAVRVFVHIDVKTDGTEASILAITNVTHPPSVDYSTYYPYYTYYVHTTTP